MRALAARVAEADLEERLAIFSQRSLSHGGGAFTEEDVRGEAMNMYRATASDYSMLAKDGRPDHRIPVHLGTGTAQ